MSHSAGAAPLSSGRCDGRATERRGYSALSTASLRWFLERVDNEADHRNADAGVGDVKRRPRVRERDVQIEEQKIDDMTVEETIGEVSHDAGKKQGERNVAQRVRRASPKEQGQNNPERDTGENDEKQVVIPERSEGGSGVRDMDETKEIRE